MCAMCWYVTVGIVSFLSVCYFYAYHSRPVQVVLCLFIRKNRWYVFWNILLWTQIWVFLLYRIGLFGKLRNYNHFLLPLSKRHLLLEVREKHFCHHTNMCFHQLLSVFKIFIWSIILVTLNIILMDHFNGHRVCYFGAFEHEIINNIF